MKISLSLPLAYLFALSFLVNSVSAQTQGSGLIGGFGIDADLYSDYSLHGSLPKTGTNDWFKTAGGTGFGFIDTTGAANLKAQLFNGANITISKGMNAAKFSWKDSILLMDAVFGRDYNGMSSGSDKTSFITGSKNGDDPTTWSTIPTGSPVSNKVDLIDAFAAMIRNGKNLSASNPSHMIMFMGANTLAASGNRFMDFELFSSAMAYNDTTGIFSNSGAASTGGHTPWQFNTDGSLKVIGDMDISFTFSNTSVGQPSIWIWVSNSDYTNIIPVGFDFVSGGFYGNGQNAKWGYVNITPKAGKIFQAWGAVNDSSIVGAPWGTISKTYGSPGNAYFSLNNEPGQFAEAAIDLTAMGIDPAFYGNTNPCNPLYRRILIKTRSSSSFTSALQDFTGPYSFLDAPLIPSTITVPEILTCNRGSATLQPASITPFANYTWSTDNGNIVGRNDTTVITINKPGTYYLSSAIIVGCQQTTDSVIVKQDINKPIASATESGAINASFTNTAALFGGDTAASNYLTSFGRSQGLLWNWNNSKGFTSSLQNPVTSDTGSYRLIVTEIRNGCTDTAYTAVPYDSTVTITGNVFDDTNGLTDHIVNGTGTDGSGLNVTLTNSSNNQVIASSIVNADGTYVFTKVNPGSYSIILSTVIGIVGNTVPVASLQSNWVNTGENIGSGVGNDGSADGILGIIVNKNNITNADFGIDKLPDSDDKTATYSVNGPGIGYPVPGLTGSDAEDGTYANGKTYTIITLPVNGKLIYNGTGVTIGQVISNFNASLLLIDRLNAAMSTSFTYASIDAAIKQDPTPATVTINWVGVLPVVLSDFRVQNDNDNASLYWVTSSETNIKVFNIERSDDFGKTWQTVGEVIAKGVNRIRQTYAFTDTNPKNGMNLYRLQVEENNGSFTYSSIQQVLIQQDMASMNVYPNPVGQDEALNIDMSGLKPGNYQISFNSVSGQIMKQMNFSINSSGSITLVIPTSKFPRGNYILVVRGNDKQYSRNVVVADR